MAAAAERFQQKRVASYRASNMTQHTMLNSQLHLIEPASNLPIQLSAHRRLLPELKGRVPIFPAVTAATLGEMRHAPLLGCPRLCTILERNSATLVSPDTGRRRAVVAADGHAKGTPEDTPRDLHPARPAVRSISQAACAACCVLRAACCVMQLGCWDGATKRRLTRRCR